MLGVKKTKKLIKLRKLEKKLKKPNREKKPIKILKKPTGSVSILEVSNRKNRTKSKLKKNLI